MEAVITMTVYCYLHESMQSLEIITAASTKYVVLRRHSCFALVLQLALAFMSSS